MRKSIIKKIRTTRWWQGDGPIVFQLILPPLIGFSKMSKYYPGLRYWGVVVVNKNDYGYQFIDEKDSMSWIEFLVRENKKDKNYIQKKIKKWRSLERKLSTVIKEIERIDLSKVANGKLFLIFKNFHKVLTDTWALPLILEGSGFYFEKSLVPRMAKEYNLTEAEALDKLSVLSIPEKPSFTREETNEFLRIALQFIRKKIPSGIFIKTVKEKHPEIYNNLLRHQKKFFWIRNNYKDPKVVKVGEFLTEIKNILKKRNTKQIKKEIQESEDIKKLKAKKLKIKKEINLSGRLSREAELFSVFVWWHDQRKRIMLETTHYVDLLIKEISKRMRISYKDGYYLLNKEIEEFLLKNKKAKRKKLSERRKLIIVFIYKDEKLEYVSGKEAGIYHDEIFKAMEAPQSKAVKEFSGLVACKGGKEKIKGDVSIILDIKEDEFKNGNILVTSMTRPEFVPIMKKAKAIITSEGGITSHAAIISRELNIPCIVGTKIATKVLKDGDLVEVDANRGVVRILKRD